MPTNMNSHVNCIRTLFTNNGFECHIRLLPGDTSSEKYYGAIERAKPFAASMEAMWQQNIGTLVKVFSDDVAEMIRFFQDYLYNSRQFDSAKDLSSNYPQFISVAGQQLDICSFTDLAKRIKAFSVTECVCERLFCQLRNPIGDFWHQMSDSMIVDLLMIKTRIICPDAAQISECAEILREVQSDAGPDQMAT
jgi:hypothetical protein